MTVSGATSGAEYRVGWSLCRKANGADRKARAAVGDNLGGGNYSQTRMRGRTQR